MSDLLNAFRFLTIIPLGRGRQVSSGDMAASMAYFPLVGAWLGVLLWALDLGLRKVLPGHVTAVLLVAALALVTGGLHLDGLADTLDGLFGGRGDKARILEIMKDSRTGAIGVVGVVLLLMAKYASIAEMTSMRGSALVLMPTLARWAQVEMTFRSTAARTEGSLAGPFVASLTLPHLIAATLGAVVVAYMMADMKGIAALALVGAFTLCARLYFNRKIGGITGDTIGCVSELNELVVLLFFLVVK